MKARRSSWEIIDLKEQHKHLNPASKFALNIHSADFEQAPHKLHKSCSSKQPSNTFEPMNYFKHLDQPTTQQKQNPNPTYFTSPTNQMNQRKPKNPDKLKKPKENQRKTKGKPKENQTEKPISPRPPHLRVPRSRSGLAPQRGLSTTRRGEEDLRGLVRRGDLWDGTLEFRGRRGRSGRRSGVKKRFGAFRWISGVLWFVYIFEWVFWFVFLMSSVMSLHKSGLWLSHFVESPPARSFRSHYFCDMKCKRVGELQVIQHVSNHFHMPSVAFLGFCWHCQRAFCTIGGEVHIALQPVFRRG